jgi:hypothetical protein
VPPEDQDEDVEDVRRWMSPNVKIGAAWQSAVRWLT